MAFGGLNPHPFRLGGTAEDGWQPEEHARLATDLAGSVVTAPLCVFFAEVPAVGINVQSVRALARDGAFPGGNSRFQVTVYDYTIAVKIPVAFTPVGGGELRAMQPTHFVATVNGHPGAIVGVPQEHESTLQVMYSNPTDTAFAFPAKVTVAVFGTVEDVDPHDYGADENKRVSQYEGETPYAYWELVALQDGYGSMFSKSPTSLVAIENIAIARQMGFLSRCAERHAANQNPATSGQAIYRWAELLDIRKGKATPWELRRRCVRKWPSLVKAAVGTRVDEELSFMFGDAFVGINRFNGEIDAPPYPTFWPISGEAGPPELDLGGGTWMTDRSRIQVQLQRVPSLSDAEIDGVARIEMDEYLEWALPAWCTWDWTLTDTGFILDESTLGRESL